MSINFEEMITKNAEKKGIFLSQGDISLHEETNQYDSAMCAPLKSPYRQNRGAAVRYDMLFQCTLTHSAKDSSIEGKSHGQC